MINEGSGKEDIVDLEEIDLSYINTERKEG